MKLTNFRVRDILHQKNKPEVLPNNDQENQSHQENTSISRNEQSKLCSVLQSLENIIASYLLSNSSKPQQTQNTCLHSNSTRDFEPRDRFVTVDSPDLPDQAIEKNQQSRANRKREIEAWVGEVCKASISIGFNYFMEKKVQENQMKAFVCQNFLRNLVLLVEKCKITAEELKMIDSLLKEKVLPYSKAKYPLTGESEVNKALKISVKSIDNSQMVQNDYIFSSEVYFEYREDGRYEDLIMRFINEIMKRCNAEDQSGDTNYKVFQDLMEETFKKSFDESWIDSSGDRNQVQEFYKRNETEKKIKDHQKINNVLEKAAKKDKIQKNTKTKAEEEYEQKVKTYTSFLIGRKISQNAESFTEDQIKNKAISIKSPAVLRILTKWCEELWQKFENETYFLERSDCFSIGQKKEIEFIGKYKKEDLIKCIKDEKEKIEEFVKQIYEKNYKQQIEILLNEFCNEEDGFIERKERVSAKFAWKSVNNIESFIVSYLNRLIHGLTTVSQKLKSSDQEPLNLVTFHVSDLFRCKYASKQKEVLKIFDELQRISDQFPHKFKIIRIKNRLEQGTHDIMINAKFNNLINCEVQIAVNTSQSEFMRCSNKINHFIYELERAQFGSLMEMCSIWRHCDKKAEVFATLIEKEKPRKASKPAKQQERSQQSNEKEFISNKDPFICSECSRHYHNSNYFQKHLKTKDSSYFKCAPCLIKQHFEAENRNFFFETGDTLFGEYKFFKKENYIPDNGAFIFINKPSKEVVIFKKTYQNFNMREYLVGIKNNKPSTLIEITSKKQRKAFQKQALLFQLPEQKVNENLSYEENVFEDRIDRQELAPDYLRKCLQQQSEIISISEEKNLTAERIKEIFDENKKKLKCLSSIYLRDLSLANLDFLSPTLENLKNLNLNQNKIQDISSVFLLVKLEKLEMFKNQIQSIPAEIQNITNLKSLDLSRNQIEELPVSLTNLKSLIELEVWGNKLQAIPSEIGQLSSLTTLILHKNELHTIPSEIGLLLSLTILNLQKNKLQAIPSEIGHLSSLKILNLSFNQVQTIPSQIGQLSSLTELYLYNNQLQAIPSEIGQLSSLKILNLSFNQLQTIPSEIGQLSSLTTLYLSDNQLQAIPSEIGQLLQLTTLDLRYNQLQTIPSEIGQLSSLTELCLQDNPLEKIPDDVRSLKNLRIYQ